MKKIIKSSYFVLVLALLYIPMMIIIVFSFNKGNSTQVFTGWSLHWYEVFFKNSPFIKSILTSLFVATISTFISLIIGLMAVIGLSKKKINFQKKWLGITNIPLINADVITAVSLMIVFLLCGLKFGVLTLIASHISFNVPYVIITIMPFYRKIDKNLIAASQDLGSSNFQTLFKVILPLLKGPIIFAVVIAFTMSFDDFIISYFTSGDVTNVATFIYTAKRVQPYINAFGTFVFVIILVCIIGWNIYNFIFHKYKDEKLKIKNHEYKLKKIKKINKLIESIDESLNTHTKVRLSKNIKWWIKFFQIKNRLNYLKRKNYDAKISKIEWKKELLADELRSEKRILAAYENALKKQRQLNEQIEKNPNSHRVPRFQNILSKLYKKINKLEKEIELINNQKEYEKEKIEHINDMINTLKTELANMEQVSKKDIQWYMKKISYYTSKKNIFAEGKVKYKLRKSIEKIENLRINNLDQIQKNYLKLNLVEDRIFHYVPLTESLNKKIAKLKLKKQTEAVKKNITYLENKKIEEETLAIERLKWNKVFLNEKLKMINLQQQLKYNKLFYNPEQNFHKRKNLIQRSWKSIALIAGISASFATLTSEYIINNHYDLVVANWGSYIDMNLINEFEEKYNVSVNYQQYDSNESLYNKTRTINYDIMVPSDYMVQRMAIEKLIQPIDWHKINNFINPNTTLLSSSSDSIYQNLKQIYKNNKPSLFEYAFPYFWGDVRVVFNTQHQNVINFLKKYNIDYDKNETAEVPNFSWSELWKAADEGLGVSLSDDARNIFMIGSEKYYVDNKMKPSVEPINEFDVNSIKNNLKSLVDNKNVALLGDQLINQIATGRFDIAVAYNGDIMYAEKTAMESQNKKSFIYETAEPVEGTNAWCDSLVLNKKLKNEKLAYEFINFIISKLSYLSDYVGYPIASAKDMEELLKNMNSQEKALFDVSSKNHSVFKYNLERDNAVVNAYNELISNKN